MLEVKNINKTFGENQILYDVSSIFEKGKVNLIIGQSGQGKSVLAKCIVGLHDVDSGQVLYDGRNFTAMNRNQKSQIRQQIGMLFQGAALFDSMTVEDNIGFPLTMFSSMTNTEIKKPIAAALPIALLIG